MIGGNIKKLRTERGLTQKNLADQLFVSAQAVSRWENDEVEPSIGTIKKLSAIFGVSVDEILGIDSITHEHRSETHENETTNKEAPPPPPPQMLALCSSCNSPIYQKEDIVRHGTIRILCKKCDCKEKELIKRKNIGLSLKRRKRSFIFGGLAVPVAIILCALLGGFSTFLFAILSIAFSASMFTFVSCIILNNNFVGEMSLEILAMGFVKMPGVIFSLDMGGCLSFIAIKILLLILGFLIVLAFATLTLVVGGLVSLFVYPYAINKNLKHPEIV